MGKSKIIPKQPAFFKMSHTVVASDKFLNLPASAQALFLTLCRLRNNLANGNPGNWFWRTNAMLCKDSKLPRSTMDKARKALIDAELLRRKNYKNGIPYYQIRDGLNTPENGFEGSNF